MVGTGLLRIPESLYSGHVIKLTDIKNAVVLADTDILDEALPATYFPLSFFIIYCVFDDAGSLKIRRHFKDLNVTKDEVLNEGYPFYGTGAYIFSFPVSLDETINFRYSQNTTVTKLTVIESQIVE